MQWYYRLRQGEAQLGPVTWEQLLAAVKVGQIGPLDFVWSAGMPQWQEAHRVEGLFAAMPQIPPAFAGLPPPLPPPDIGDDLGMRVLLPVGRSPWAIVSGYLGLFSVLFIFAPFAILTGVLAIRQMRRNPKMHGMGRAVFGIVMGSIFTIALLVLIGAIISDPHR